MFATSWQTQYKVSTTDVTFCHIPLAVVIIIKLISIAHDRSATTEPKRKPNWIEFYQLQLITALWKSMIQVFKNLTNQTQWLCG